MTAALIGYYTITPTHCGTGQAAGGVDLPIVREPHTGHPIFPATSIKGALRHRFAHESPNPEAIKKWFGRELATADRQTTGTEPAAGNITFGEARILAFPVRALHTSFCHVTCPLILERFERDLGAYGLRSFFEELSQDKNVAAQWSEGEAFVGRDYRSDGPLILEDLCFDIGAEKVVQSDRVNTLGVVLGRLLPENEKALKKRLRSQLVVLRDDYFCDIVYRTTPVQARIHLNDNKTTAKDSGNLWYEETLPADTLLASFVRTRNQKDNQAGGDDFFVQIEKMSEAPMQIGGNETVGQGLCLWQKGAQNNG